MVLFAPMPERRVRVLMRNTRVGVGVVDAPAGTDAHWQGDGMAKKGATTKSEGRSGR